MTAVDLTVGAILSNGGEITTDGRIGINGAADQYPGSGEPLAGHQLVSTPENPRYGVYTSYVGSAAPRHSHVAKMVSNSPASPDSGSDIWDEGARAFYSGGFPASCYARRILTTEAVAGPVVGCYESLEMTPTGGTARQPVRLTYGNGDMMLPVAGSRILVGATSLTGISNHSGISTPLTPDVGNVGFAVFRNSTQVAMYVGVVSGAGFNYANSAMYLGKDANTGRSLNAGGTVNASGADYAEYERKAEGCGDLIPGQIIGFDANGLITDKWDDSISFGVISTNPSFVGGDDWKDAASVERIAYCGKVPVNVMGALVGSYIVAEQDGEAIKGYPMATRVFHMTDYSQWAANCVGRVRRILDDGRAEIAVM